jgi:hypothetical protein
VHTAGEWRSIETATGDVLGFLKKKSAPWEQIDFLQIGLQF